MRVDIYCVSLVPRGLLKIDTIRMDLLLDLGEENALAQVFPFCCAAQKGKLGTEIIESESLTCEVRVGAVVLGQVLLDMTPVTVDRSES